MASSSKNKLFNNIWDSKHILQLIFEYDELESDTMRAEVQLEK